MGIDINQHFSTSNSLKAADIPENTKMKAVIEDCNLVEFQSDGGQKEQKLRISFAGNEKGLILNKTNATTIASMYGNDTDGWRGKEVLLYRAIVDYQGNMVPAIRIDLPMQTTNMGSFDQYPEAQ